MPGLNPDDPLVQELKRVIREPRPAPRLYPSPLLEDQMADHDLDPFGDPNPDGDLDDGLAETFRGFVRALLPEDLQAEIELVPRLVQETQEWAAGAAPAPAADLDEDPRFLECLAVMGRWRKCLAQFPMLDPYDNRSPFPDEIWAEFCDEYNAEQFTLARLLATLTGVFD